MNTIQTTTELLSTNSPELHTKKVFFRDLSTISFSNSKQNSLTNGDDTADLKLKATVSLSESVPALGKLKVILEDPNNPKENEVVNEASLEVPAEEIYISDATVLRNGIPVMPSHMDLSLFSSGLLARK